MVTPTSGKINAFTPTPIYGSSGELVGIDDPIQKVSRLPTTFEKAIYERNIPIQEVSRIDKQTYQLPDTKLTDVRKQIETYDPRLGMYISTSPRDQFGTSVVTRPPTIDESRKVREAHLRGSIFSKSESEIMREAREEKANIKKFETLTKDIDTLEPKELEKRLKELEKIEQVKIEGTTTKEGEAQSIIFKPKTVGVGIGLDKKQVPISRFDTGGLLSLYGSAVGYGVERGIIKLGYPEEGKTKEKTVPKGEFKVLGGTGIFDPSTGKYKSQTIEIPEKKEIVTVLPSARTVGDVVATGRYFIPYAGASLFFGEMAEKTGRGTLTKGEKLFTGGVILTLGALKMSKFVKSPIVKDIAGGQKLTTRWDEFLGKKIIVPTKRGEVLKVLPSKRYLARTTREIVARPETKFIAVSQPEMTSTGIVTKTRFKTITSPSIVKDVTTFSPKGKELLKTKVDKIVELKTGKFVISEPFAGLPVTGGKPFILRTARLGKKGLGEPKYTLQIQKQKTIPKEEVSTLGKIPEYVLSKTIEKGKLKGVPIKSKDVSKYISEEERVQLGMGKALDILSPEGKRISTQQFAGLIKKEKQVGKIEVYDILSGAKDVSKPLSRATGRVDIMTGKYMQLPTISKIPIEGTTFVAKGKITKTPFAKTFPLEQVQATIPFPKPPKIPKTAKIDLSLVKVEPSVMRPTSIWAGTGLYERTTEVGAVGLVKPEQTLSPVILLGITKPSMVDTRYGLRLETKQEQRTLQKLGTKLKVKQDLKLSQEVKPVQRELSKLKEGQAYKERLVTKQLFREKLVGKQVEVLLSKQKQRKATIQKSQIKIPKTPIVKIPLKFPPVKKEIRKKGLDEEEFAVWVRKKGEDIEIGEFTTLPEARKKLKSELKETLRASGFVTKGGKKLKFGDIGMKEFEFIPAKRDSFRVVQKREKRIKTGGEIGEILKTRKTKRRLFK